MPKDPSEAQREVSRAAQKKAADAARAAEVVQRRAAEQERLRQAARDKAAAEEKARAEAAAKADRDRRMAAAAAEAERRQQADLGHIVARYTRDDVAELQAVAKPGWDLGVLLAEYPGWPGRGMADPGAQGLSR